MRYIGFGHSLPLTGISVCDTNFFLYWSWGPVNFWNLLVLMNYYWSSQFLMVLREEMNHAFLSRSWSFSSNPWMLQWLFCHRESAKGFLGYQISLILHFLEWYTVGLIWKVFQSHCKCTHHCWAQLHLWLEIPWKHTQFAGPAVDLKMLQEDTLGYNFCCCCCQSCMAKLLHCHHPCLFIDTV